MSLKSYYCIVRYVPDLVRGEGINIGVALEAYRDNETSKRFKFAENFQRAAKLDPTVKADVVERSIRFGIAQIMREATLSLEDLVGNHSGGQIQFTEPRLTLVDNPEEEVADLFSQFVVVDPDEHRQQGKADSTLRKDVKNFLAQQGINGDRVQVAKAEHPILIKGNRARHSFDLSVRVNSHNDYIRCISFDVKHYAEKLDAAKALIYDVKDIKTVNKSAEVISVLYPPKTQAGESKELFREAQAILGDEKIPAFNFDSADEINQLITRMKKL